MSSTQSRTDQMRASTYAMKVMRFALILAVLYVASVIFNALLSFVIIAAACVLGAMFAKVFKSIDKVVTSLSSKSSDEQLSHNTSTTSGTNSNNTAENISHNNESINNDKNMSSNKQVTTPQKEASIVSSYKYGRCVVSDCVVYIISHTLVFALASHLDISVATTLACICSIAVLCIMPNSFIAQKIDNVADVVSASVLDTASNVFNNTFIKKPAEFMCNGATQIYNYIGVKLS